MSARDNRSGLAAATGLIATSAVGATAVALNAPQLALQAVAIFAVVALLRVSRGRLAPAYLSPITIASVGLLLMALVGVFFYGSTLSAGGGSAEVLLSDAQTLMTQTLFATAGVCIMLGGLAVVWVAPKVDLPAGAMAVHLTGSARTWILAGACLPLVVNVLLSGSSLFSRTLYLEQEVVSRSLLGLTSQLSLAAVIALGYLAATSTVHQRIFVVVVTLCYFLLFFAGGSRRLAMLPALFALGLLIGRRNRATLLAVFCAIPLSLSLIGLALFLRGQSTHGLIPYVQSLPTYFATPIPWDSITRNIFISFGIVGATAFQQPAIDPGIFWVSINPLPGTAAGWYGEAAELRINAYTPYAGIGELGNYGTAHLVAYCVAVGMILGVFERQVRELGRDGMAPLALIPVGLAGLFVLYAVQYNLRTASRMLIYGIAASVALAAVAAVARRRRRAITSTHRSARAPDIDPGRSRLV